MYMSRLSRRVVASVQHVSSAAAQRAVRVRFCSTSSSSSSTTSSGVVSGRPYGYRVVTPQNSHTRGAGSDEVPWIAKLLGFAGLAPFAFYAPQHRPMSDKREPMFDASVRQLLHPYTHALDFFISGTQEVVRQRFLSYGACILSFMGAVHWGLAMSWPLAAPRAPLPGRTVFTYAVSVVPSLLGWLAVNADARTSTPYALLATGFVGVYLYDENLLQRREVVRWYTYLRTPLTFLVVASITCAAYIGKDKGGV